MPGHLCFVNSIRPWGGAEVWFLETALELKRLGHRVSIVCQPDSELYQRSVQAQVATKGIPLRTDASPWTIFQLARYFREQSVTAIVANMTKDVKASGLAGKLAGVPVILATRESDFPLKDKLYYRWAFNGLSTGMLVNSLATRKTTLDSAPWLNPDRVHLLYKGIDLERFCPAPDFGNKHDPPVMVGFVGQLINRKGLPQLMQAWGQLEKQQWPAQPVLKIAGEGPLAADLASWRQQLNHPDQVLVHGYVEDVAAFYRSLDLLAMPSLAEGFGLAAAEAGACGLPVIATTASSLPEIVRHQETGLLIPPEDDQALEQALHQLLASADLRLQLGAKAQAHIRASFDRRQTMHQLLALCGMSQT